ncbi:hypothetical protein ACJ73_09800 [Blastomyces percursus]|uniref:Uncharacterized protein n=1 Tax=Blastomyces percursus TaxID=1658174 RepID=A0A1J9P238_9EURO|nr:hypothetical protein ACJ73_09800 [Blastomyces percursus]
MTKEDYITQSLPALEKLTLSKIVAILLTGEQNKSADDRHDVCGSHNHGDTSSGLTDSSNDAGGSFGNLTYSGDKELSSNAGGSSGGVATNVYKIFKLAAATIPSTLQEVLKGWKKNLKTFFEDQPLEDQPQNVPEASGWGALFRKIHHSEVNADVLKIRRRFDLYYFFQSIQNCEYHDGNRWVYRARITLAKKVLKQSPSLQLNVNKIYSQLDLWAELGRGYDEWVKEFKHPGCLLLLPLNISETEYTERRYRKYKYSAAQHLIKIGFQKAMREWDVHALGSSIVQGLKERYQSLVEDTFVTPRAPKRHRGSDESRAKTSHILLLPPPTHTIFANSSPRTEFWRIPQEDLCLSSTNTKTESGWEIKLIVLRGVNPNPQSHDMGGTLSFELQTSCNMFFHAVRNFTGMIL